MKTNGLRVPILVYHHLSAEDKIEFRSEDDFYTVNSNEFRKQMRFLSENGYSPITLGEFCRFRQGECNLPSMPIVITFDDGHISNYSIAWPMLKEFGFKAVFFIIVGNIGTNEFIAWEQIKELAKDGIEIGSHGLSHRFLSRLSKGELEGELKDSKSIMEEQLQRPVEFLSLPGGFYNKRVKAISKESGYKAVCTSCIGFNDYSSDLFSLKRIAVKSNTAIEEFKQMLGMPNSKLVLKRLSAAGRGALKGIIGVDNYTALKEYFIKVKK